MDVKKEIDFFFNPLGTNNVKIKSETIDIKKEESDSEHLSFHINSKNNDRVHLSPQLFRIKPTFFLCVQFHEKTLPDFF